MQLGELGQRGSHTVHGPSLQWIAERVALDFDVLEHDDALAFVAGVVDAAPVGGDEAEAWDLAGEVVVETSFETVDPKERGQQLEKFWVEAALDAQTGRWKVLGFGVTHLDEDLTPRAMDDFVKLDCLDLDIEDLGKPCWGDVFDDEGERIAGAGPERAWGSGQLAGDSRPKPVQP